MCTEMRAIMKVDIEVQDKKGINESEKKMEYQDRAEEIIKQMKRKTGEKYPVLYALIYAMQFIPVMEDILLETDGINIFYSPGMLVKAAKQKKMKEVEYGYIHIMLHGLLQHYTKAYEYERDPLMHVLMDYEVSMFMSNMNIYSQRDASKSYINQIGSCIAGHSLLGMRRMASDDKKIKDMLRKTAAYLWYDDYKVWTRNRKFHTTIEVNMPDVNQGNGDKKDKAKNSKQLKQFWDKMSSMVFRNGNRDYTSLMQVLMGKRGNSTQYGELEGAEEEIVKASDKAQVDYISVLRHFFKLQETSKENVESIDKAMYSWGMSMYDDIAFIEPEAESENVKMNTIVLAIDTSGSCYGEILSQFLAETKELFMKLSKFDFKKFVVIQCDASIQRVDTYKNVRDFPSEFDFNNGINMCGFGGTDFVPVFDYIDNMQKYKDKVDCLIYLTDGYGEYPDKAPKDYKTFFVLDNDTYNSFSSNSEDCIGIIPDWISVLKLKERNN